jgi:hypothetical protein
MELQMFRNIFTVGNQRLALPAPESRPAHAGRAVAGRWNRAERTGGRQAGDGSPRRSTDTGGQAGSPEGEINRVTTVAMTHSGSMPGDRSQEPDNSERRSALKVEAASPPLVVQG